VLVRLDHGRCPRTGGAWGDDVWGQLPCGLLDSPNWMTGRRRANCPPCRTVQRPARRRAGHRATRPVRASTTGLPIIQVDEPALREGLPLRRADHGEYLRWATRAFRVATNGVWDVTQIHTHMCYAEFGDILDAIMALDADVISLEAARSRMHIVHELAEAGYRARLGRGVPGRLWPSQRGPARRGGCVV